MTDRDACLSLAKKLYAQHGRHAVPAWWEDAAEFFTDYYAAAYAAGYRDAAAAVPDISCIESQMPDDINGRGMP